MRIHANGKAEILFFDLDRAGNRINAYRRRRTLSIVCTNGNRRLSLRHAGHIARSVYGKNARIAACISAASAVTRTEHGRNLRIFTHHDRNLARAGFYALGGGKDRDRATHVLAISRPDCNGCLPLGDTGHLSVCTDLCDAGIGRLVGNCARRSVFLRILSVAEAHLQHNAVLHANFGAGQIQTGRYGCGLRHIENFRFHHEERRFV